MPMTKAQIDEFNKIRASQNDMAAADWAEKQGIPVYEYVALFKNPVTNQPVTSSDITKGSGVSQPSQASTKKTVISESDKIAADTVGRSKSSRDLNSYKSGVQGYLSALNVYDPAAVLHYVNKINNIPGEITAAKVPDPVTTIPSFSSAKSIPHPEEPMNPLATLKNTDTNMVITKWLTDWGVPTQHWAFWKNAINIQVYDVYPASIIAMGANQDIPALTWEAEGKRHLAIKPKWLNPGVIAHEQAHNSYALLDSNQKAAFSAAYTPIKNADPLIKFLYSKNTYGLTNDIEGHAEVYRYIGQFMPAHLKPYYPKLF